MAAVLLLAAGVLGAQIKKEGPKPVYLSKEDEVAFTDLPVRLTLKKMMAISQFYAPGTDTPQWSRVTKASRKKDERVYPPTLIALPLVYPPLAKERDPWKAVKDALRVAVTTNRKRGKYIRVERRGYDKRDPRFKLPPGGPQFALYDRFVRPDTVNRKNDGTFGPFTIPVRYASDPRTIHWYWIVLRDSGKDAKYCEFRRAGYWEGKLPDRKGETVRIVDENSNGWFNDYGHDVIVVGKKGPTFLSKMIILGRRLYHMKVAPSGAKVWLKKYGGETGGIDIVSKFKAPAGCKLTSVVIRAEGGGPSFDVVPAGRRSIGKKDTAVYVPVGKYVVIDGSLVKGRSSYRILQGYMEPFEVKKGETAVLEWGKPLSLDFKIEGLRFGIYISDCGIYGSAGELYLTTCEAVPMVSIRFRTQTGRRLLDVPPMEYGQEGKLEPYTYDPRRKGFYWITLMQKLHLLQFKMLKKSIRVACDPGG